MVIGQMTNSYSTGYVYIDACQGPTGAGQNGNYVIVYGSNNPSASQKQWIQGEIGYVKITQPFYMPPEPITFFVGWTSSEYKYVAVGCVTMGGVCTYNDVAGDSLWFNYAI